MPSVFRLSSDSSDSTTATDTSTNASSILAINGVFCGFTVLVVAARIYVRAAMLKTMGTDDYLMAAATLCGVGVLICFVGETSHGLGRHNKDILSSEMIHYLHWQFFHSLLVTVGISLIKLSMARFLLRLVPGKGYKVFLYGMIVFLVAFTFSSAGTIVFSCVPIRATWDPAGEPNAKCFSNATFTAIGMFNSVVNIITDVLFASLPIPMVWNLQVNMRTKATLLAILSLGYFACSASIVKTVIQASVLSNTDSLRNDAYFVWNSIELYIGILAASLPSLRPLFRRFLETTRDMRTRVTGSSGRMGATRHKYYMHEDGIGMNSMPTAKGGQSGKYDVKITTVNGRLSEEDYESTTKSRGDNDSAEDILPMQGRMRNQGPANAVGITRTVDVVVS